MDMTVTVKLYFNNAKIIDGSTVKEMVENAMQGGNFGGTMWKIGDWDDVKVTKVKIQEQEQ